MLLSEEEIKDNQFYLDKFTEPKILEGSKRVAEAQLKKVADWLKRSSMDGHTTILQVSTREYETLLKEVK